MKKRIISMLLVLLFVLAVAPAAFAVTTNLGSFTAGTSISQPITTDSFEGSETVVVSSGTLPNNCSVIMNVDKVFLVGTPTLAGTYEFTVTVGEAEYECSVYIEPATPVITTGPGKVCHIGENVTLNITASVTDNGTLSYQWYSNTVDSTVGGVLLAGANSPTLAVAPTAVGTTYYFCTVTNSNNGLPGPNAVSGVISVTAEELPVSSVAVKTMPKTVEYEQGEYLKTDGMVLTVTYSDGTVEDVTGGFSVFPTALETKGEQEITVSYKSRTCTFKVTVKEPVDKRRAVVSASKTQYEVGDQIDLSSITLRIYDGSKYTDVTKGFTCEPSTLTKAGQQQITVSYDKLTATYNVTVKEKGADAVLSVKTMPNKTSYSVGDTLDTAGLTLELRNKDEVKEIKNGFTCEPSTLTNAGNQNITVSYGDYSCSFNVMVEQAQAPETPAETQAPSAPEKDKDKESRGGGFVVFVLIVALLALAALIAYVVIARSENVEDSAIGRLLQKLGKKK